MISTDLIKAKKYIYEPLGLICTDIQQEQESQEYGACTCTMNGKKVLFRVAKITPTKAGLFVTLWKRSNDGPIVPYDASDDFDVCIVHVSENNHWGQFIFTKQTLLEHGIISQLGKGGKRAMRVYPYWTVVEKKQAQTTQKWQLRYFFEYGGANQLEKIKQVF